MPECEPLRPCWHSWPATSLGMWCSHCSMAWRLYTLLPLQPHNTLLNNTTFPLKTHTIASQYWQASLMWNSLVPVWQMFPPRLQCADIHCSLPFVYAGFDNICLSTEVLISIKFGRHLCYPWGKEWPFQWYYKEEHTPLVHAQMQCTIWRLCTFMNRWLQ